MRCRVKKTTRRLCKPSEDADERIGSKRSSRSKRSRCLPLRSYGKKETNMKIRIDGGVVVGWSGTNHELVPNGSVLIDGDKVASVGTDKSQTADKIIDASGRIVSPGFVNLHVHSQLNIGDYLLTDVTKKDYLAANWFVFGAPLKEKWRRRRNRRGYGQKVCALQRA